MERDNWTKSRKRVALEGSLLICAGIAIWIADTFIQSLRVNIVHQIGLFTLGWFLGFVLIGLGVGIILVKFDLWGY